MHTPPRSLSFTSQSHDKLSGADTFSELVYRFLEILQPRPNDFDGRCGLELPSPKSFYQEVMEHSLANIGL